MYQCVGFFLLQLTINDSLRSSVRSSQRAKIVITQIEDMRDKFVSATCHVLVPLFIDVIQLYSCTVHTVVFLGKIQVGEPAGRGINHWLKKPRSKFQSYYVSTVFENRSEMVSFSKIVFNIQLFVYILQHKQ